MNKIKYILLFVVLAFIGIGFKGCREEGVFTRINTEHELRSPKGVRIVSRNKINAAWGARVDAGLTNGFRLARLNVTNYPAHDRHNLYTVALQERSPKCRVASFLLKGTGQWDGTEFDMDPNPGKVLVCAAGFMRRWGLASAATPGMVVVDDLVLAETIVWYESEHNELIEYDVAWFQRTQGIHAHPIFSEAGQQLQKAGVEAITMTVPEDLELKDGNDKLVSKIQKGEQVCILVTK